MNKNVKIITKILITILMVIGILLILSKNSIGFTVPNTRVVNGQVSEGIRGSTPADNTLFAKSRLYYDSVVSKTLQQLIGGASLTVTEGHVFQNNFVFCIEHGQNLNAGSQDKSTYSIDYKITFDGKEIKRYDRTGTTLEARYTNSEYINCFKKITYILSQIDGPQCKFNNFRTLFKSYDANNYKYGDSNYYYGDWHIANRADPIQNALWTLVHNNSSITNTVLTTGGSNAGSSTSIYTAANGTLNGTFDLTLYVMKHSGQQSLIIVKEATFVEGVDVTLNFNKVKMDGTTKLNGAKISVEAVENVGSIVNHLATTDSNSGNLGSITVNPSDLSKNTFKIKIKETKTPGGYIGISETTLTVTYNTSTGAVTNIASDNTTYVPNTTSNTVSIKNKKAVELTFYKRDFSENNISGAKIKVTGYEKVSKITGRNSDYTLKDANSDGIFDKIIVYPSDNSGQFKLKVVEDEAPNGYIKFTGNIILTVTYNTTTGEVTKVESNNKTYVPDRTNKNVIVRNQPVLTSLKIVKLDALNSTLKLDGVKFNIELTGVEAIKGHSGTPTIISGTTNANGEIVLEDIVLATNATQITVKITEKEVKYTYEKPHADGYYYKVDETPITFTIKYDNGSWSLADNNAVNGTSIRSEAATISEGAVKDININIKNQPYIALSGMVWQDGQTGDKIVSDANGIKDDKERALGGVAVRLYKIVGNDDSIVKAGETNENNDDKNAYKNADGEGIVIYTQEDGTYEFKDVPKTNEGYRIIFGYDGINYQETNSFNFSSEKREDYGKDSKIVKTPTEEYEYYKEIEKTTRTTFNNTFKTIGENKAIKTGTNDATTIGYNYDVTSIEEKGYIANIGMDGTNLAVSAESQKGIHEKDFQMRARTAVYKNTTANINCGLVKKVFDLALTTNVEKAEVTINGASTTYTDFSEPIIIDEQPSSVAGLDNLYLYASDYNYRKADYKTDNIENNVNPDNVEGSEIAGDELEIYVTYKVSLMNQTYKKANVDKFIYYYDGRYTLIEEQSDLKGYKINSNSNNMIEFEKIDKNTFMEDQIDLTLKFKVNKYDLDGDGTIEIKLGEYGNAGEIIEYTTEEGGLIDKDSAPGNSTITHTEQGNAVITANDEDDSDQAKGLNIQIKEDKIRKISGTVFEDTKTGNKGQMDDGEQSVNEVIVQLIEIKKLGGLYYEYIWQEKSTDSNGYYEFTNFIPSGNNVNSNEVQNYNYIVRFIYGDGAAYDLTPNRVKYNGQDYKSTKDINYKEVWYNNVMYNSTKEGVTKYDAKSSVARDNEARRLEVMAHSSTIDGKVGTALEIFTNNVQYSELTNIQKQNIVEYYNSIVKTQYDSVKGADEINEQEKYLVAKRIEGIFGDSLPAVTAESMSEDLYNKIKRYVSYRTWMAAETSRINVQVDAADKTATGSTTLGSSAGSLEFDNINFGLALRPETKLVLEKHITGLKITPSGTGVQPIVDARADINQILDNEDIVTTGVTTGLATIKSDRSNRGFWKVETDVEEIIQGAQLEVEYTYVIKNEGEEDYLSNTLVEVYENRDIEEYSEALGEIKNTVKGSMRLGTYAYTTIGGKLDIGTYLGQYYYNGNPGENDSEVKSRVETLEQALNNEHLKYDSEVAGDHFASIGNDTRNVFDTDGNTGTKDVEVLESKANHTSSFLKAKENDVSKTLKLTTVLSSTGNGQLGTNLPSYIAEITSYSNAAGRRDMSIVPANLSYVHSDNTEITMNTHNEVDEFWGESIIISKPTGEDKITLIQIVIISISSLAVIATGIILIKKIVLKK